MILLAADPRSDTGIPGILVVAIVVGVIWLLRDISKRSDARSERRQAMRSLNRSQRRALARINRSAKAYNGSTKGLWSQFGDFKGNPKAFGKEAAALHKAYKASKKKR